VEGYCAVLFWYHPILFLVNEIVDISLTLCSFLLLLLVSDSSSVELHDSQKIWTNTVNNDCLTMVQSWNKNLFLKKEWPLYLNGGEVKRALIYIVKNRTI